MQKQFSEVAHLYLGCEVVRPDGRTILKTIGIENGCYSHIENNSFTYSDVTKCKPILRRLEDIKYEDCKAVGFQDAEDFISYYTDASGFLLSIPDITYLLSKGYDLHGLIDNGFAIDAKTIKL